MQILYSELLSYFLRRAVNSLVVLFILIGVTSSIGCVPAGSAFKRHEVPEQKGIVYIFRPYSVLGVAIRYDIYVGDQFICLMSAGAYCEIITKPGKMTILGHEFMLDAHAPNNRIHKVEVNVPAGGEVFVRNIPNSNSPHLFEVQALQALSGLAECRLVATPVALE